MRADAAPVASPECTDWDFGYDGDGRFSTTSTLFSTPTTDKPTYVACVRSKGLDSAYNLTVVGGQSFCSLGQKTIDGGKSGIIAGITVQAATGRDAKISVTVWAYS